MQDEAIQQAIAALGTDLGPEVLASCQALFREEQSALAAQVPLAAADCPYGPDPRHRLDLYGGGSGTAPQPVLLFVHGGGFVRGDKGGADDWTNASVGRMAAQAGMVGAVMNYRLAPEHGWPAGGEDVLAALAWLRANVARWGGDPARIVLAGTSAGAVHVATALKLDPAASVRGAVLLSGLYGFTPLDPRDRVYYGAPELDLEREPGAALVATSLPLFLACAQFDPPRFQQEFLALMSARLGSHGVLPPGQIGLGHNHYTLTMHLGTHDRRLANAIIAFVQSCCAG